ncbi:MAG: hypothetical protein ACXADL_17170 [Candidatus Thorarchaeota archaeon]|jgi:hypothetical protein
MTEKNPSDRIHNAQYPREDSEEPVQFIVTAAQAGINLLTVEFQPCLGGDESLLSGYLTALSSFSNMFFFRSLDLIRMGEYVMLMKVELPFLFCYIFKGQTHHGTRRLNGLIDILKDETKLWNSLAETITTGAINISATSNIEDLVTQTLVSSVGS